MKIPRFRTFPPVAVFSAKLVTLACFDFFPLLYFRSILPTEYMFLRARTGSPLLLHSALSTLLNGPVENWRAVMTALIDNSHPRRFAKRFPLLFLEYPDMPASLKLSLDILGSPQEACQRLSGGCAWPPPFFDRILLPDTSGHEFLGPLPNDVS